MILNQLKSLLHALRYPKMILMSCLHLVGRSLCSTWWHSRSFITYFNCTLIWSSLIFLLLLISNIGLVWLKKIGQPLLRSWRHLCPHLLQPVFWHSILRIIILLPLAWKILQYKYIMSELMRWSIYVCVGVFFLSLGVFFLSLSFYLFLSLMVLNCGRSCSFAGHRGHNVMVTVVEARKF